MNRLIFIDWEQLVSFFDKHYMYLVMLVLLTISIFICVFIIRKIKNLIFLAKKGNKKEFRKKLFKYIVVLALIGLGIYLSKIILGIVMFIVLFPVLGEMMNVKYHDNYYESNNR